MIQWRSNYDYPDFFIAEYSKEMKVAGGGVEHEGRKYRGIGNQH
jgi:hypothetical protein